MKSSLLLLLLAAAPHLTAGASIVDSCLSRNVDNFYLPPDDQTSFFAYSYEIVPGAPDECESVVPTCFATVPNERLSGRVLYVDDFKSNMHGLTPVANWIQIHRIVCPEKHVLHIVPLRIDTEDSSGNAACTGGSADFIRINIPGQGDFNQCGDNLNDLEGYNSGLGLIAEGGNATITFCSNTNPIVNEQGFAYRVTCVDPSRAFIPGCVNFEDKFDDVENGRPFVDRIDPALIVTAEKANIPHKRDAEDYYISESEAYNDEWKEKLRRSKRSPGFEVVMLDDGDSVRYMDNTLTLTRSDGTMRDFTIFWLETFDSDSVIGTRRFDVNLPTALQGITGPGFLLVLGGGRAQLMYTLDDDDITRIVLPSVEAQRRLNILSDYLYENFVLPYPFTLAPMNQSSLPPSMQVVPLPLAEIDNPQWRYIKDLDFLRPDIQNGTCVRSTVPSRAPDRFGTGIDRNVFDFCQHFYYSCNPLMAAVCSDAIRIRL